MTALSHHSTNPNTHHRETQKHLEAFEAWYEAGCSFRKTSQILAVPERTIYDWASWFDWHATASRRNAEVQRLADAAAAQERAERLEQQRKTGTLLRQRGVEYLLSHEIGTAREAVAAIKAGIAIEQRLDILPDWLMLIVNADDRELAELERAIGERLIECGG